jgi:beta-glucanase (GH16 family)
MRFSLLGYLPLAFALWSCSAVKNANPAVPQLKGYSLVFSDEFDQKGVPNPEFWSFEEGFQRNNELQWYQSDNASVADGLLIIEGRREKIKNTAYDPNSRDWRKNREYAEYSSSSINTRGKFQFQYGIMEVRAKIDTASGIWPAIWTLGVSRPWPANGEIDVMEYYQVKGIPTILANAAWAHPELRAAWDEVTVPFTDFLERDPDWPNKFHVWKMDWTAEFIRIYLDGELLNEIDLSQTINPDGFNPFHQPHYILLNMALGSNGGPLDHTSFPRNYEVDYVRVYQKK